jgi:hypothetical protein
LKPTSKTDTDSSKGSSPLQEETVDKNHPRIIIKMNEYAQEAKKVLKNKTHVDLTRKIIIGLLYSL